MHVILYERLAFHSTFWEYPTKRFYLTALTWLVPHETAAISAHSVYTIHPCTMTSCKAKQKLCKVCNSSEGMGGPSVTDVRREWVPLLRSTAVKKTQPKPVYLLACEMNTAPWFCSAGHPVVPTVFGSPPEPALPVPVAAACDVIITIINTTVSHSLLSFSSSSSPSLTPLSPTHCSPFLLHHHHH